MTLRLDPHELHVTKYSLFSPLLSSVSGERQVLQVTYSPTQDRLEVFDQATGRVEIHTNITPQHILNLFLLKPPLNNQPTTPIHTPTRPQLRKNKLHNMFLAPLHPLANIRDVRKDRLLIPLTETLRGGNDVAFGARGEQVGVRGVQVGEEAFEEFVVFDGAGFGVGPDSGAEDHVAFFDFFFRLCGRCCITARSFAIFIDASFREFGFEVVGLGFGGLLFLFLLQGGGVEFGVGGGGRLIACGGGLVFWFFGGFLFFGEAFEELGDFVDGGV